MYILSSRSWLAAFAALALLSGGGWMNAASAHSNEELAGQRGPNQGMLRAADQYHLELVVQEGRVRLFVTDHADTPQSTAGARGRAMVLSGNRRLAVDLVPSGDNALEGSHPRLQPAADLRVVVTLNMPEQPAVQARFTGGDR